MPTKRAIASLVAVFAACAFAMVVSPAGAAPADATFDGTIRVWSDSDPLDFDVNPLTSPQSVTRRITISVTASQPYTLTARMLGNLIVRTGGGSCQIDPVTGHPLKDALGNYVYEYGYNPGASLPAARMSLRSAGSATWVALSSLPTTIGGDAPAGIPETRTYSLVFQTTAGDDFGWDVLAGAYTSDVVFELVPDVMSVATDVGTPVGQPQDMDEGPSLDGPLAGDQPPSNQPSDHVESPSGSRDDAPPTDDSAPDTDGTAPDVSAGADVLEPSCAGPAHFFEESPAQSSVADSNTQAITVRAYDAAGLRLNEPLSFFLDGVAREAVWAFDLAGYRDAYVQDDDTGLHGPVFDATRARLSFTPPTDLDSGAHSVLVTATNRDGVRSTCSWSFWIADAAAIGPVALLPGESMFATPTVDLAQAVESTLGATPREGLGRLLWLGQTVLAPQSAETSPTELAGYTLQLWVDDAPVGFLTPLPDREYYVCLWSPLGLQLGQRRISVVALGDRQEPSVVAWQRWVVLARSEEPK